MPIFEYNGKKYNVRDEHIDSFMKDFPDASTIMEREGKKYRVKSADYRTFMSEQQQPEQSALDSTPETPVTPSAEEMPLTEQDKIRFSANIGQMKRRTEQMIDGFNERMETMREYHENAPLGGGQTAEGKMQFNPESGKLEKTYITPLGNRYTSKGLADMESFRYRQAADMSVNGQLRRAMLKLAELQEKREASAKRVHEQWEEDTKKNTAPLGFLLAADTYVPRQMSDKENSTLDVAIRQTEELIKDLEEQKDREQGIDVGFWRGFGRVAGDFRTWDFGMSDMRDALTMMNADDLKGENATEGEREAYNEMMGALYNKGQAEQMYGGNAGFWNRAGMMTGHMPAFMLDFGITGGGFKGINVLSKAGTKAATKVVGKETVEQMAKQGFKTYVKDNGVKGLGQYATNWTIKALGTTADDLLLRAPLMTNTVQAGKTTADIIDRKLGDVVVDENGNYDFSNDKTWGNAIWQGEANAIVENYSEMFGSHLDPVVTLGNMSKLANVVGAKRIGAVLSKTDAGALDGIMGQTHQLFNKMGVSDYFGEVTEEYYGQLWRTMLNLDDAYQQNPDGTRTNLLATGQFHGDIWGGMALSMGLMGAGKATLSGVQYASMKHGVNKADARATELLGKEIWEPLRATIDLTTNDDIGSVAEGIVNDKDFSDDERAAILTYMERSLMMRGFNLGTLAQKRGGEQDEDVQSMNESYIDGYNLADPQEMTDAKNMRDYQRQRVSAIVDENTLGFLDIHPMNALEEMRNNGLWGESELETVIDYLNAKQVYDGMIQRVRDDIDARVEQSNAMVDARTNRTSGMIQGATMKQDDRRVYVVGGNLVQYADGSGIDNRASDGSIIVRDAETGALEQVSPDAVLNIDEPLNPSDEKMTAEEAIIQQFAQEASDKIDGVVTFNPGDTYTITGDDAQIQVQIVANEDGIVDNGDGTVNVSDGVNIFPLAKETIQQQADAANLARVAQFEQQRTIENAERKQEMQEAERPQYALNDIVSLTDENGVTVRGNITADADADGKYEVFTEAPINGKRVNLFTRDELDNMLLEHNGVAFEHPAENESNNGAENIPENDNNAPQNIPAMQRIPKDEQGNPLYEQADSDTAWDAIVEQTEGDEDMAQTVADGMVADKEEALKKLEKAKSKGGNSIAEKIASEKERKAAIDAAKQDLLAWQKIAGTANRRRMAADAERKRMADEAAALRKAEEEKLRAEREEAERVEREALNGVPDMVDDTPQDARARGYRRVNGHKIDRQEPLQTVQGKEVNVKFSNDVLAPGHVAVIDASLLQPSHIQGVRNPLHFIDEAQPKERNDEASVLSARKIAGNIRPEEITSSITAYTGAPTVNERGEVIQGNNRSDALRLMWESHPEQAEAYRQYLKDHAEEFGLRAEDIAALQSPVLVNMLHVDDATAIPLGQYVAQDTESGGVERIKPKNALQRMGIEVRSFANLLLRASDDEVSFAGLVDANGASVLKWMSQRGFISPTQYKSAFDSKGNLTPESKNDLRGIMYQSIFKDGSTRLEEMFNVLPVKAQKAILATAFRDYDSPNSERMVDEIQNSVRAYYALSQDKMFVEAKNFKEARTAVESWKRQYQMDDVTGESYLPADNFSNFVLHLAAMYKGESQSFIQNTFGKIYDLIQGTQEETLFEQPDNTPRTLVQAIKEALNLDYNGQQRSNVLVGDTATSQRGQQGSNGTLAPRERVENGNGTTDDTGRTESIGGQSEIESSLSQEEMLSSDDTDNQLSAKIARRIEVQEDDWIESGKYGDTYKQTIIVDGTHKVIKVDAPDTKGNYIGSAYEYDGQTFGDLLDVLNYIDASLSLANAVAVAEKETDTTPTEKQKEAGNYKKGHVQVGTFNITIENPKGSVRSGIDTEGNKWKTIMQNTYGYIRGTEGVDGDHIDVFLSDDIDGWNGRRVFVVDQYNEDGSFDEHKVMLGFNETDDAEAAYFANYDSDWANNHKTVVTAVNLEDFEKWIDSSHRKTKAFAEYKSVKSVEEQSSGTQADRLSEIKSRIEELHKEQEAAHGQSDIFEEARIISEINDLFAEQRKLEQSNSNEETTTPTDAAYTITPAQYTTKRGKVLDMHLVKFNNELRDTVRKHTTMFAKQLKGWWDKEKQGFMMRSKEDAERLAEYATDAQSQPPLSLSDLSEVNDGNVQFAESQLLETSKQEEKQEYSPVWQYSVSVDKKTGLTTLKRDDVSGPIPIGDGRFNYTANSPEEMLEIVRNPKNFNQELRDAVETILENKVKIREIVRTEKAEATEQESKPENNPSGNRLVTDERYAELRERMRKKLLGQMNMGIDPEILAIGTEMAVYHLEKGARKFTEYATAMVADLGDSIRPYLKAFYNGARDLPEVAENGLDADMTPYDEVQQFDVTNFDKKSIDALATAETVTRETEVEQEAEIAQERIKKSRPARKKNEKKAVISQQSNELGLFDALTDNNKNSEHGLQRTDAERSERVPAKGYRHEQGLSRGTETGSESEQQAGRGTDNEGERTGDAVDRTVRPRLSDSLNERSIEGKRKKEIENNRKLADELKGVTLHLNDKLGGEHEISGIVYYELANVFHCNDNISGPFQATRKELDAILKVARKNDGRNTFTPKNTHNNHSERGKDHAPTSVDARIEANIKAIELAKQLLENGEQATEKQMQTLRKFSGWGGLGKAFSEGAYYAPNPTQKKLRELLGEKAYQEAVMSANSAYYTPAYVVDTLWDIAEKMGFEGGNILEGSAGIGNILGQMPAHISERSDIHAIEIDGTSGGILSLLYPDAKVDIQGFEQTRIPNGSIDLAITNVPFVTGLRVNDTTGDKDLSKKFHNIHDFCIAKNVRKLREGGLGIFITSNGTLDNSKKLRDWIVNEGGSDFVGAFRMHNKTFGGTGVTSDIVVIRKRVNGQKSAHVIDVSDVSGERMAEYDTGETRKVKGKETPVIKQLSMDYNRYFIEHPENMAGEMHFAFEKGDTFRPTSKGLYPAQDKKQEQMLSEFVHSFKAEEFGERNAGPVTDVMPDKKIGEIFIRDGKLFINSTASAQPLEVNANKVKGHTKVECFEAYTAIKEALAEVLSYQTENESDEGLKPLLDKLNKAYDDFVGTYGHFNKNTAIAFLRNDVDYANVFALEKFEETADEKGNRIQKFEKTDVFSKRVVEKDKEPTPANVKDGIIASIFKFGRVDIPYIAEQLGTGIEDVKKEIIESGYGFEDPVSRQMEASYQYLSGNIREKLRQAEENNENGEFDRNIKALQEVMPMEIPAHLIDFTLGSSWIDPKLYEDFVKERTEVDVRFTAVGGTWFMKEPYFTNYEKNRAMGVTSEMLGRTIMGHTLIEAAIQNRSITVSTTKKHYDGTTETITDKEATQACAAKIDEIRQDFKDWARQKMQSDPEMSERMERIYNDMFNNFVPMSIPDEFVPEYFGGASHKFKMRPHQGRAIVRGTQQPLLLAHEVGTGKTFTLISTAMEMRRLGTARKPMIVVQNATVGQFVASAKELYPNAKILTLEEADRSAEGRKNFYAKIRYNDWDMIVVPQSTFEFIPDSEEREMTFVQDKIEEKMLILEQMKEEDPDGKNMITRQAEREIELLEEQLAGLADNASKKRTANDEKKRAVALQNAEVKAMEMLDRRTDDVENFDDMGIDALLVDEAHEYKHLGFATAMQRGVKGVDPSYSKKSQGVFLKTQAVLEKNNGRNVIFATGTPISNTAAEIWTFMRYLMPADTMKEYGIYYFDDFVRNFGNIQQMLEFTTSGKFKENNRFAGYVNLPELVRIWSGVSDTVLTKEAGGVKDKIPEMEGGKAQDLYLPQTRALRSIMKFVKSELEHYEQMSGKEKKENSHIPLTMYGIAKAAAVDARLVQSDAEDDQNSKTNEAVRQTLRSLKETADYKGTVAIFADNYQNKQSGFNLYDDIRNKLIAEGVPADEIVVMRSGMTVKKKLEIFEKVNRGEVRVILGSTFTLGTGVNIQERLHTLIHLDAPNRPMDYTQRNGRILRQGNLHKDMNKPVRILRFGVEDSLDVTAYQRLKTKGAIADSIMNGKQMMNNSMTNRVLEEEEDVFGDTVAQLSGSEYAMLKNNAEKNVRKYASRKKQWETDQTYIHNAKPRLKAFIKDAEKRIEDNGRYLEAVRSSFPDGQFKEIVIGKHRFTSVDTMDDFFKEYNKSVLAEMKQMKDGEISGEQKRELIIQIGDFSFVVTTKLARKTMSDGATLFNDVERRMTYSCLELGIEEDVPVRQNLLRNAVEDITDNVITGKDFAEILSAGERSKKHNEAELKELLSREGKPFEYEEELAQAKVQLEEYAELMKKELEEKEAKYAEMDATVETANNISTSEEDDELKREGDGAYTDDEVSYENDPTAKQLSQSRRTAKQRREFARRERQRMAERVESLAEKLHLDNVEVVTDASVLDGKKQRAKGFYSKSTGKITIVIPNHTSTFDVEQTLLHEAVAHYGLRQLFGEHFDTFLDNVFNNADENIRRRIVDMAAKNGWDFHKATEEYLASLAEDTEFENINASWWQQIKDFFLNMLHKIGFEDFRGVTLSDNELRYILWRSYENLAEPGRYRNILGEAADVAKQYELKVGNYAVSDPHHQTVAESDDALYRTGDPEIHERELARDRYERRVKSGMFQSQEALQDSMLGLKEAMTAILGKETNIEDVDGFENAYLGENRLSSVNKAEADAFAHTLFKPMLDEVAKLARTEAEREELTDYMMAKHGLERNTYMRNEAINNGATDADQTDYAGLTALTGMDNVADAETEAQIMVNDYEQAHDTTDLWKKVNAASKAILSKSYECGMMSKATFDKISDMYDFYIPLRGFDEKTSSEAYAYLTHKQSAFNAPIKKAEGRRSKADDPFANLQSMAEGAIMQGNRNKLVKQRFLNFALNHPSDLVSVSDIWVEYDTVADEWKPVFPDNIDSTDTPEVVERKMLDFETKMESLAQQYPDRYKHGKDTVNIPYRIVESRDMRQHQIVVKRGGRDYVITINGNPRAAQALNGQTNPDNDMSGAIGAILRAGENINRQLSAFYTTRNPDFIVSNFMRDMLYTNTMTWIRESPNYALRFHRNYMYANPVRIKQLLAKHRKGTLDMSNKTEAMFHQFMMNGGETGYANIRDIEQHKNDIRRELKKSNGKIPVKKAWDLLGGRFDEYNRAVENCARFAAFMTSREMGRSIDRAIYDAKEISVNFNKKGSGAKFYDSTGQTKAGNASALVSGLGRSGYVFWNAAIQGTANFGRQMKRHPAKAFTGIAAMFLLGAIVAYLGGDDDDDDDKNAYYNLPEYVRRSNILFRAGNSWVSIPLPVEYRAVYGMGELMISVLNGKEHLTDGEIAEAITGQATQILPIDFLEGGGGLNAFVPSAYKPLWEAYVAEKSWTGMPLYKDTPYNKDMPEWTKAYKSANKYIVGLANAMNEATGGDPYTKGTIDFNPAKIEYMLNGYFGGVFGTIDKLSKMVETVTGNREYDPRSFLLANRLVKAGDERTEYRAVNNEYFRLKEEHDRLKSRLKHYEEDTDNDIFDYAEKIDFLYNSPEYERYEIFEDYREDIDDLYNELKEAISDEERKDIEAELNELKKEMIEEMNKTRK
ncbi:LPD38 domain-containing protein [Bacteroides uniformis]|uniref:LPD38 domain-containing protein n=5 Tax=Bacteroidaceae TaxID=815 RepID=UPI0023074B75|nr:LPD38 domain-containing protein [Bacteroides uniformis]MDB0809431.1 helicase-related protein [Phocaeicola vulgatus]MDC1761043.1 helicase-related protein [Bacteroides uniformis]